jgi:ABC-type dipeptide/oligopeptide/nickel transport system ATPase component
MNPYALTVQNLTVSNCRHGQAISVVDRVSLKLRDGEVLAIVGESGCGKTKTAEAIMGLLPRDQWNVQADAIELGDSDLATLPESGLRKLRGRAISMIFQEPLTALDPVFTIGNQLGSIFRRHRGKNRQEASRSSAEMLESVGFADTGYVMRSYPHQLSGGMRQRVMIAMAMACRPRVLIADEPTTALDVTTQAQVLDQLSRVAQEYGTAIVLITHDLGVVAQYCDRALVMLCGQVVEEASVQELFARPQHAYTRSLLGSLPAAGSG